MPRVKESLSQEVDGLSGAGTQKLLVLKSSKPSLVPNIMQSGAEAWPPAFIYYVSLTLLQTPA